MRDFIHVDINGKTHEIRGPNIYTTLANWLRYDACATGTKIVCEEGDCGACTVLIRRAKSEEFVPVNSCILSLCQLDGASIITVEGMRMNAVQQSMIAHHGARRGAHRQILRADNDRRGSPFQIRESGLHDSAGRHRRRRLDQ